MSWWLILIYVFTLYIVTNASNTQDGCHKSFGCSSDTKFSTLSETSSLVLAEEYLYQTNTIATPKHLVKQKTELSSAAVKYCNNLASMKIVLAVDIVII